VHKEFELDFVEAVVAVTVAYGSAAQNSAAGESGRYTIRAGKKREEKSNSPPGLKFGFWLRNFSEP
jgi:hypothetical protein